ncbi:MAG: spondin domain-containing protein [Pirellulales bacterium]
MKRNWTLILAVVCSLLTIASASPVAAVDVRVTIRNLSPAGSVALSPFTLAAHDGSFDGFNSGSAASLGVENVAELGDGSAYGTEATSAQASAIVATAIATQGGFGPGIFRPGASGSIVLSLDPALHRYLSYGSMVVPSNDSFLGNDSPTAVELFDAGGNFVATDFTLTGERIWDAGTEVNQLLGAAYVAGQDATLGDAEGGVVHLANLATQFAAYLGSSTPAGETFSVVPGATSPVASFSFTVVPEPATAALASLGALGLIGVVSKRRLRR